MPLPRGDGELLGADLKAKPSQGGEWAGWFQTRFRVTEPGEYRLNLKISETGETISQVVNDLPASERFFAGGDTTVRGFTLDRLGRPDTIDANGFPKGGHGLIVLNAELRTPLLGNLGGVGFLDVGNVFAHVNDINLGQLRASVGFGIRYKSPIGPIRVDLGIKLARQLLPNGDRERLTALHISLGQAF